MKRQKDMKIGQRVRILDRFSVDSGVIVAKLSKDLYQVGTNMGNLWAIDKKSLKRE